MPTGNSDCNSGSSNKQLKLIHLLWILILACIAGGISWGMVKNQQSTNVGDIEKLDAGKVEKEVFEQHKEQQYQQFESINDTLKTIVTQQITGFDKIDARQKDSFDKLDAKIESIRSDK